MTRSQKPSELNLPFTLSEQTPKQESDTYHYSKLFLEVFSTKKGEELLAYLYRMEVLASKDFLSHGSLARQVGRSDLILSIVNRVTTEKERINKEGDNNV